MQFRELAIRITTNTSGDYLVEVVDYPVENGNARERVAADIIAADIVDPPPDLAQIKGMSNRVEDAATIEGPPGQCLDKIQELGSVLANVLFPTKVRKHFLSEIRCAEASGDKVRARLQIRSQELCDLHLPYEYCFIGELGHNGYSRDGFLALNQSISLVRDDVLDALELSPEAGERIRILLVSCSPPRSDRLWRPLPGVADEEKRIMNALSPLLQLSPRIIELDRLPDPSPSSLLERLRTRYQILIYLGYGDGQKGLVLNGPEHSRYFDETSLAIELKRNGVRLVFLNACWTGRSFASRLSVNGIPAVVAMRSEIPDSTAELLSEILWRNVANYFPIDLCVAKTRDNICHVRGLDRPEWGIPALFLRARSGDLFRPADTWIQQFLDVSTKDYNDWRAGTFMRGYADVYINPDHILLAPSEQDLIAGKRRFEKFTIMDAAWEFTPLLVLGDPGVGKTTALRELLRRLIRSYGPDSELLPLYIPIVPVDVDDSGGLTIVEELLSLAFRRLYPGWDYDRPQLWAMLSKYRFALLFDGLNEIPENVIPRYCQALTAFCRKLQEVAPAAGSRVVITSRLDNISRHIVSTKKITKYIFEVQKLTDEERIGSFAQRFFDDPQTLEVFLDSLMKNETAKGMAQTPLLLTGMMMIYSQDRSLPSSRPLLLKRLVEVMMIEHGITGDYGEQLQDILSHLAFQLRARGLGLGGEESVVRNICEEYLNIRIMESGNGTWHARAGDAETLIDDLVRCKFLAKVFPGLRFWLETFQEYFAARALTKRLRLVYGPQSGPDPVRSEERATLMSYIGNPNWHQILAISVGLLDRRTGGLFVKTVQRKHPLLAALCMSNDAKMDSKSFVEDLHKRLLWALWLSIFLLGAISILGLAVFVLGIYALAPAVRPALVALVIGIHAATGFSLFLVASLAIVVVLLGAWLLPYVAYRAIDWANDKLLENLLPDRYVQPLLRCLVVLNTPTAIRTLSALDEECQRGKWTSRKLKVYVHQANLIWRFWKDDIDALVAMLKDREMADYALDRLGQLQSERSVPSILEAVWTLPKRTARHDLITIVRIARSGSEETRRSAIVQMHKILGARKELHYSVRVAAYDALLSLGADMRSIQRPHWWEAFHPLILWLVSAGLVVAISLYWVLKNWQGQGG